MSVTRDRIEEIAERLAPLPVEIRPMFGGACLYLNGRVVALVQEDDIYLKRSTASDHLDDSRLAPPYPRARDHMKVEDLDDDALRDLIQRSSEALPTPRLRKRVNPPKL